MTLYAIRRFAFVMMLALSLPALAADQGPATLVISQPWSRATPPGASVGVAYMQIANKGAADTLLRAESPVASEVQMHTSDNEGGMMRMRRVESLDIPARGHVEFKPSGLHFMLVGLKQPLKESEHVELTLVFRNAGPVHVDVIVQALGASPPS